MHACEGIFRTLSSLPSSFLRYVCSLSYMDAEAQRLCQASASTCLFLEIFEIFKIMSLRCTFRVTLLVGQEDRQLVFTLGLLMFLCIMISHNQFLFSCCNQRL